jgi:glycosyltransferase involved in cell wall biosynthesis
VAFFGLLPVDNAATRIFCVRPLPRLRAYGIEGTAFVPSSPSVFRRFRSRRRGLRRALAALYWYGVVLPKRVAQLTRALACDVIFVQRGLLRYSSRPVLEAALWLVARRLLGRRLVYHLDDALYTVAPARRIAQRCRRADLVLTGNADIAAFARGAGGRVEHLDGWVETSRYCPKRHDDRTPVIIGYTGSSPEEHLAPVLSALRDVCSDGRARIRVVSRDPFQPPVLEGHIDWERWSPEREFSLFEDFDIGVMPLEDTEYNRAKEAYKIKEYMAAGLAVVCSPIGHNVVVVEDAVNGLYAKDERDWVRRLSELVDDAELRARLGAAGRLTVEQRYDADRQTARLGQLLRAVGGR